LPLVEGTSKLGWSIIEQPVALHTLTDRYVEKATNFMKKHTADGAPWVLYVPFTHVHTPQYCSPRWCNTSSVIGYGRAIPTGHGGTGSAIQEMDESVGSILAALKETGADENTLVFFTSDNGAPNFHAHSQKINGSNHPLKGFKGHPADGGVRMPAMVRWTGQVAPGSVSRALVATYDIFTTMLTLAGVPLPADRAIDGRDLTPVLLGQHGATGHDCVFIYAVGSNLEAVRCVHLLIPRIGQLRLCFFT